MCSRCFRDHDIIIVYPNISSFIPCLKKGDREATKETLSKTKEQDEPDEKIHRDLALGLRQVSSGAAVSAK